MDQDRPVQHFPGTFSIKAVGKDDGRFVEYVLGLVRGIVGDENEISHRTRASRNGVYLSVTVSFVSTDQAQLDRVFAEVSASERTVWVL